MDENPTDFFVCSGIEKIRAGTSDKLAIVLHSIVAMLCGMGIAFYMRSVVFSSFSCHCLLQPPDVVDSALHCARDCVQHFRCCFCECSVLFRSFHHFLSLQTAKSAVQNESAAYGRAGALATEILNGIRTVLSFNAQPAEIVRYGKCLDEGRKHAARRAFFTAFFTALHLLVNSFSNT